MKKLIISLLAAVTALSGSVASVSASTGDIPDPFHYHPYKIAGDADCNGVVDPRDATYVAKCISLNNDSPVKTRFDGAALYNWKGCLYVAPNGQSMNINLNNADFDRDGYVTEADATLIIKLYNYNCLKNFKK